MANEVGGSTSIAAMVDPVTPEAAIRRYLAWVDDPDSVVDAEAVARAEAAFAAATDPIDRLHAAAARERARVADVDAIRAGFVRSARAYAEAEGIPVEAFRLLGVSDDTLREAGFGLSKGQRSASAARGAASTPRGPQVSVSQLKSVAAQMPKQFTLSQLGQRAGGGSPATIRKAVEELIAEGRAAKLGPDPSHRGPGRAPTAYELR